MQLTAGQLEFDRVRCAWQPYRRGDPAEPRVRAWLQSELGIPAAEIELPRDRHGRPQLGPAHAGLDASWSHSGNGLLMALGTGVRLGCDLELARPRPRALELARRYFTSRGPATVHDFASWAALSVTDARSCARRRG